MPLLTLLLTTAVAKGTVNLVLVDAHNKPLVGRDIWLTPTNSTKALRPFGVQWYVSPGDNVWHGTTNAKGQATIKGVPLRKPLMVVCNFGNRFDDYVRKSFAEATSVGLMKFEGAVYAGKPAKVVLAEDYRIVGKVTDYNGKPIPGSKVYLSDTGFGHMGGYPGTTLDEAVTAADGTYSMDRLPNCAFIVSVEAPDHYGVYGRTDNTPWEFLYVVNQGGVSGYSALLRKPETRFDFQIVQTAEVKVDVTGTFAEVNDWTIWLEKSPRTKDTFSDYTGHVLGKERSTTWHVMPGTYQVIFDNEKFWCSGPKFTVGQGEQKLLTVHMRDALKTKKRK